MSASEGKNKRGKEFFLPVLTDKALRQLLIWIWKKDRKGYEPLLRMRDSLQEDIDNADGI